MHEEEEEEVVSIGGISNSISFSTDISTNNTIPIPIPGSKTTKAIVATIARDESVNAAQIEANMANMGRPSSPSSSSSSSTVGDDYNILSGSIDFIFKTLNV